MPIDFIKSMLRHERDRSRLLGRFPTHLDKHESLVSRFLPGERTVIVYLPPGYHENSKHRYPVLYLQDGQNLFDPATAYVAGMDWRVDQTAEKLILDGKIEPLLIVGIYNNGEQRLAEYTPTRDGKLGGGQAELYGRMLVEDVKPFIDGVYRTLGDPENTGLGGSSLGGLVSLYLGLLYPQTFGKLAILSPSVWWNHRSILNFLAHTITGPRPRIWLDIGTQESRTAVPDTILLRNALLKNGWVLGKNLRFTKAPGARHEEAAWARRVGPALKFLFPR